MPTCTHCHETVETADLERHESRRVLVVRCPACHGVVGSYREPGRF